MEIVRACLCEALTSAQLPPEQVLSWLFDVLTGNKNQRVSVPPHTCSVSNLFILQGHFSE